MGASVLTHLSGSTVTPRRSALTAWSSSIFSELDILYGNGSYAVGPIEEVGIVGRPPGDEEQVLLRALQRWDSGLGVILQMLQFRAVQPLAAGILGHGS